MPARLCYRGTRPSLVRLRFGTTDCIVGNAAGSIGLTPALSGGNANFSCPRRLNLPSRTMQYLVLVLFLLSILLPWLQNSTNNFMAFRYSAKQLLQLNRYPSATPELTAEIKTFGLLQRHCYIHRGSRRNLIHISTGNDSFGTTLPHCFSSASRHLNSNTQHHQSQRHVNHFNLRSVPISASSPSK